MYILARLFLNALAVMVVAYLVPGVAIRNFPHAFVAALILGVINAFLRPALILLSLPVNILTLGFLTLIINALLFWLAASLSPGFRVDNFGAAFWGALVFWIVSWLTSWLVFAE